MHKLSVLAGKCSHKCGRDGGAAQEKESADCPLYQALRAYAGQHCTWACRRVVDRLSLAAQTSLSRLRSPARLPFVLRPRPELGWRDEVGACVISGAETHIPMLGHHAAKIQALYLRAGVTLTALCLRSLRRTISAC